MVSSSGRKRFITVKLESGKAYPVYEGSGDITSMVKADGYLVLPVNLEIIEGEEEVTVTLFE